MSDQGQERAVPDAGTGPYANDGRVDERPEDEESAERLDDDYDVATAREQNALAQQSEPQEGPAVVDGS